MFGIDDIIAAGAVSAVGGLLSGDMNNDAAQARQDSANAFSAEQYAKRWQTTTADMQAAGLNPMLAYSQGVGNAPSGAISNANPYPNIGEAFNQGRLASAQVANLGAQSDMYASSAELNQAQINLVDQTVTKVGAEVEKIRGDTNFAEQQRILRQTAEMLYQQGNLMFQQGATQVEVKAVQAETVKKLGTEIGLNNLDLKAAQDLGNMGRSLGQLKPLVDMIVNVLGLSKRGITINR